MGISVTGVELNKKVVKYIKKVIKNNSTEFDLTRTFAVLDERVNEREVIVWYFQHTIVLFCLKYRRRSLQDEVMKEIVDSFKSEFTLGEMLELQEAGIDVRRLASEVKIRGNWLHTIRQLEAKYLECGDDAFEPLVAMLGGSCFSLDFQNLAYIYKVSKTRLRLEVIESFLKCCGYEYVAQDFRDGLCDSYIWNS